MLFVKIDASVRKMLIFLIRIRDAGIDVGDALKFQNRFKRGIQQRTRPETSIVFCNVDGRFNCPVICSPGFKRTGISIADDFAVNLRNDVLILFENSAAVGTSYSNVIAVCSTYGA